MWKKIEMTQSNERISETYLSNVVYVSNSRFHETSNAHSLTAVFTHIKPATEDSQYSF